MNCYAKCHYTECHYAECQGTNIIINMFLSYTGVSYFYDKIGCSDINGITALSITKPNIKSLFWDTKNNQNLT